MCLDGSQAAPCDCPRNFYFNTLIASCERCFTGCTACVGPGPLECLACDEEGGYALSKGRCIYGLCEGGTFFVEAEKNCRNCATTCLQCSG